MKKMLLSLLIAATLFFVMFSQWTSGYVNFWAVMSCTAALLTTLAFIFGKEWKQQFHISAKAVSLGILSAVALWFVFYFGEMISTFLFDFARPQIDSVYGMRKGENLTIIGLLLLLLIAPAEEIFWRGYIQRTLTGRYGKNIAFVLATAAYTLVHIWSFNFILIMAAMVVGCAWGWLYRQGASLVTLIISHALWDVAIFVLFPTSKYFITNHI